VTQRGRFLLAVAVLLVAVVYFPLTKNYFVYDDFLDLYEISNESVWTYLIRVHGGHVYLVRNLIFYLCHRLFGAEAAYYFWVVLITLVRSDDSGSTTR